MMVRGERLQEKGQVEQALVYFQEVLRQYPNCDEAKINLNMILKHQSHKQHERSRCYLPSTMFWTSPTQTSNATSLQQGSTVLSIFDTALRVTSARLHETSLRSIVELKTRAASLRVTADYRI